MDQALAVEYYPDGPSGRLLTFPRKGSASNTTNGSYATEPRHVHVAATTVESGTVGMLSRRACTSLRGEHNELGILCARPQSSSWCALCLGKYHRPTSQPSPVWPYHTLSAHGPLLREIPLVDGLAGAARGVTAGTTELTGDDWVGGRGRLG